MDNNSALISRAQAGDEGAFTELMRAHYAFVYAIVIGIVNNHNDAEEVVQEIFLNAYRGLPQLEDTKRFKGWLTRIARNRALNWLREQRIDTVSIDEVSEDTLQSTDSPDEQLIRREQRELIRRAMETLSKKDRDIAQSYYLDGASYDELIRTHGLSYKAISFRLSRAKQKLAKRLGHLLTGVFVSPITSLKQIYSGGLTVMKVGTVPKITAGVVAIIILAFIGTRQFISSKEDTSPSVEVVTSTPSETANSVTQTDTARKDAVTAPLREDKPQISVEEMGQIEDFFAQLEGADAQSETDTTQQATDAASDQNSESSDVTNLSVVPEDTSFSAEELMDTYLDAYRNFDFEALLPYVDGTARNHIETSLHIFSGGFSSGGFSEDLANRISDEMSEEKESISEKKGDNLQQMILEITQSSKVQAKIREMIQEMYGKMEIVSSEYVGDEFHFGLRVPMPKLPGLAELPPGFPEPPESIVRVVKMRNVDGMWKIYERE